MSPVAQQPVFELARAGRAAARPLARTSGAQRNAALLAISAHLRQAASAIADTNALDLADGAAAGLDTAMLDRLRLDVPRVQALADDVQRLATLPDPLAECFEQRVLDNGLQVHKRRVPIGLVGIIYEARPNVTIDALALTLKTGNAVVLRGGSESQRSNSALVALARRAIEHAGLDPQVVQFIERQDRDAVLELLHCGDSVDLLIPRGGAGLHALCRAQARMPVTTGGIGICHLYLAASADLERAIAVIVNAKTQRPTVCNALDVLLLDAAIAAQALAKVLLVMRRLGVTLKVDARALALLDPALHNQVQRAGADDFDTEWLALTLSVAVVDGVNAAIDHVSAHSSGHSDGILTEDPEQAACFLDNIDSAAVYWNASTRFTDGGQLGLGAEVAVSTQRIHARGPMGLDALTSYKWVMTGNYHVRM